MAPNGPPPRSKLQLAADALDIHELKLERLEGVDIDCLPFGVVEVDSRGVVRQYNAAESAISGLDRDQVLGRNFFTEVAPCTAMPRLYGRFLRGVRDGSCDFSLRLVFNFKMAPRRVHMRIVGSEQEARYRILVKPEPLPAREVESHRAAVDYRPQAGNGDDECAKERIHEAAAIQPHGTLLALEPAAGTVACASDNLEELFNLSAAQSLGQPLKAFLGDELANRVLDPWGSTESDGDILLDAVVDIGGDPVHLRAHRSQGLILLELEVTTEMDDRELAYDAIERYERFLRLAPTTDELARRCCAVVAELTGMERCLVYRFESDWSGVAITETRRSERLPALEGLHFPESDIPAQARALYARSLVRSTPNAAYVPVPLLPPVHPKTGHPLDLSFAELRSVSGVHREYHRNMGVGGSFSMSLLDRKQLWGLVVGHHSRPRYLGPGVRASLRMLGRLFDLRRREIDAEQLAAEPLEHLKRRQRMIAEMDAAADIDFALTQGEPHAGQLFGASGIALVSPQSCVTRGSVPPVQALRALARRLAERDEGLVYLDDQLGRSWPEWKHVEQASGVAALRLDHLGGLTAFWFRPERRREIHWSGQPKKALGLLNGRLRTLPRLSFERWSEEARGSSEPWEPWVRPALDEFHRDLAGAMVGRLQDVERLNNELEQLSSARYSFLRNMSHELRTPLMGILGLLDLHDESPERREEDRALIRKSAESLLGLINDVLDYSRMEAGKPSLDCREFAPAQSCETVIELLRPLAAQRSLELIPSVELDASLRVMGDPSRVEQLLMNLVGNALKFTTEGSVELRAEQHATDGEAVRIRFTVIDTGIGFDEGLRRRLFEPFVQGDTSSTRRHTGTGLGLALCRTLVEAMGGEINCESTPGVGSTFYFVIPFDPAAPSSENGESANHEARLAKLAPHVLVADDNAVNRLVLERTLKALGCTSVQVEDGAAAVEALEQGDFDVVLMDLQMPVLDGIEATRRIRRLYGPVAGTPILAVSADVMGEVSSNYETFGFDAYVSKPVGRAALAENLVTVLSRKRECPSPIPSRLIPGR